MKKKVIMCNVKWVGEHRSKLYLGHTSSSTYIFYQTANFISEGGARRVDPKSTARKLISLYPNLAY